MDFEFLDHTADVAVRLRGPAFEALLETATLALRAILVEQEPTGAPVVARSVRIAARDRETVLVDYLNELIYLFDTERLVPLELRKARLERSPRATAGEGEEFRGEVCFEAFDPERHSLRTEVKAATFHALEIRERPGGLEADVVFDL